MPICVLTPSDDPTDYVTTINQLEEIIRHQEAIIQQHESTIQMHCKLCKEKNDMLSTIKKIVDSLLWKFCSDEFCIITKGLYKIVQIIENIHDDVDNNLPSDE